MLCHMLCLCMQHIIKPVFFYIVNNFLALIYNIYVDVTNYVLYCIIFGEKLLQRLRGLLFSFSCRLPYIIIAAAPGICSKNLTTISITTSASSLAIITL